MAEHFTVGEAKVGGIPKTVEILWMGYVYGRDSVFLNGPNGECPAVKINKDGKVAAQPVKLDSIPDGTYNIFIVQL